MRGSLQLPLADSMLAQKASVSSVGLQSCPAAAPAGLLLFHRAPALLQLGVLHGARASCPGGPMAVVSKIENRFAQSTFQFTFFDFDFDRKAYQT